VLGQPRAVQRYTARVRDDEAPLTGRIVELASVYGRYGSPRITGMLRNEGWNLNHKRVERIWRQAGLKVPRKQPRESGQSGSIRLAAFVRWVGSLATPFRSGPRSRGFEEIGPRPVWRARRVPLREGIRGGGADGWMARPMFLRCQRT